MDKEFLSKNLSKLHLQIKYLKHHGFPGLCQDTANILEANDFPEWDENSLYSQSEALKKFEELSITLPFAGTNFTIRLYFNLFEPWVSPDVIFSDSQFMRNITVSDLEQMVPSLNDWDFSAEDILAQLIFQSHQLYKKYQLNCLEFDDNLLYEYQKLLKELNIGEEDVEISSSGGSNWVVSLLIRLPLSLKNVPPVLVNAQTGTSVCLLQISVKKGSGSIVPRLLLSPQVESLIGDSVTLGLPTVCPGSSSFVEYSLNIFKLLEQRVESTIQSFQMRKKFMAKLICEFASHLLEYDAEKMTKASFLFDWKDFRFLVLVRMPDDFPLGSPRLFFSSIHSGGGANHVPLKKELTDLSYPPESSMEDILKAVRSAILSAAPKFKSFVVLST